MRIAIDARFLGRDRRGMGRYVENTLAAIGAAAPEHEIVLMTGDTLGAAGHADVCWCPWNRADLVVPETPIVVTIHDLTPLVFPVRGVWRARDRASDRRRVDDAIACADTIVTCSSFIRQQVVERFAVDPWRVVVVPEGVSQVFLDGPPAPRDGGVFWVGTDEARKNLACLIEAFGRVRTFHPEVPLVLGGDNPDIVRRYAALLAAAGVADNVHVTGYLSDEDLARRYRRARVFVCPSLYEGFGLPVLEAMASRTPVVCSNAAALPETGGDAALYFDPHDSAGLSEAMCRCLGDEALCADLAARGHARAAQFTWTRTARRLLSVFETACLTSA